MSDKSISAEMLQAAYIINQAVVGLEAILKQNQRWLEDYFRRQQAFAQALSSPSVVVDPQTSEVRSLGAVKPKPVEFMEKEGWRPEPWNSPTRPTQVHAIKFEDGSVFDVVNGWRK